MIGAEHWLFLVEYLLYICSYFIWGFKKKKKKEKMTHPLQEHAACSGLKQAMKRDTSLSCQIGFGFLDPSRWNAALKRQFSCKEEAEPIDLNF